MLHKILHKTLCAWGKNLCFQWKGSTKGDWEELNKETYVCNVCVCL